MARIFLSLSLFAVLLLAANLVVGITGGDFNAAADRLAQAERAVRMRRESVSAEEWAELESEYTAARAAFEPQRSRASLHMLLGIGAALVAVLVNSITVTYFIGTGRWCREVCETYHLDEELIARSNALKRRAFPWSVTGILATMAIVSLGAASDPSALGPQRAAPWVSAHYLTAVIGIAVIAYAFFRQLSAVGANFEVIQEILDRVRQIRQARGLDPAEDASAAVG